MTSPAAHAAAIREALIEWGTHRNEYRRREDTLFSLAELVAQAETAREALLAVFLDPLASHGARALARSTLGIPFIKFASPEEMLEAAALAEGDSR